tara:strand:- start:342 stop:1115 length:774 start_codon:yes stop_codon:yes gene_type:complete
MIILVFCYFLLIQKDSFEINKTVIPKIIYKTGKTEKDELDPRIKTLFNKIKSDNPGYEVLYYSDKDAREFINKHFDKEVLEAYDAILPGAYKADIFRFCALYITGGIYGDLTQTYYVGFSELIDHDNDELVLVDDIISPPFDYPGIQINFMAARPRLKIFKKAIKNIVKSIKNRSYGLNPLDITGPYLFKRTLNEMNPPQKYRCELETVIINNLFLLAYKNDNTKIAVNAKLKDHNELLKRDNSAYYGQMWTERRIY